MKKLLMIGLLALNSVACSYSVHIVQANDLPKANLRGIENLIEVRTEQHAILGVVTDNNYVDQAYQELQSKCPNGDIKGITTQYLTAHGFLSWKNKLLLRGYCIKS